METANLAARQSSPVNPGSMNASPPTSISPQGQALARHFLTRLERLVNLRRTEAERLSDQGIHLLDLTIYSSLCDCIDSGAGEVARAILQGVQAPDERSISLVETSPVGPRIG